MLVKGKLVLLFRNDLCVHNLNVSLLGHVTLKKKLFVLIERVEKSTSILFAFIFSVSLAFNESKGGIPENYISKYRN